MILLTAIEKNIFWDRPMSNCQKFRFSLFYVKFFILVFKKQCHKCRSYLQNIYKTKFVHASVTENEYFFHGIRLRMYIGVYHVIHISDRKKIFCNSWRFFPNFLEKGRKSLTQNRKSVDSTTYLNDVRTNIFDSTSLLKIDQNLLHQQKTIE